MRIRAFLAVAVLAATAAGCGTAPSAAKVERPYRIPTSSVDVPYDGVSWLQGTTLHVDGRVVDTDVAAQSYALLPDGVLLTTRSGDLWFSDTRSPARRVGTGVVGPNGVTVSPDGRHVAFLDDERGPTDKTGEHFYRLNVLDTRTGREVLTSQKGMGDVGDYRAEQYEDQDPGIGALSSTAAYVSGVGDSWRIPFDGSTPTVDERETPRSPGRGSTARVTRTSAGFAPTTGFRGTDAVVSPDGSTGLVDTLNRTFQPYDVGSGKRRRFDLPTVPEGVNRFTFGGWSGSHDFWGFAFHGDNVATLGTGRMVTCAVHTLRCTAVSGTITSTDGNPLLVGGMNDIV